MLKKLIDLKNNIEDFYRKRQLLTGYLIRFAVLCVCLFTVRYFVGFNETLSNFWIVLLLSALGAFIPLRFLLLLPMVYFELQMLLFSVGIGIVAGVIFALMYMLFFRYSQQYGFLLMLFPILTAFRIPLVVPLVAAIVAGPTSLVSIAFGSLLFYMMRYVNLNAAVLSGMGEGKELVKMSMFLEGTFTNREFIYFTLIIIFVFMFVYYIKKVNVKNANMLAVAVGTALYIMATLGCEVLFGTLSAIKLLSYAGGGLVSGALALLLIMVVFPLDYSRTETIDFEDDEYTYYLRAVPKASYAKETIKVKRINRRRKS